MLINVESLDKTIRGRKLLKDVSFTIMEGEGVGFIGPNGEGKSTLLDIITGKDSYYTGSVKIKNGISYSYLTQDISLRNKKTVEEELEDVEDPNIDKVKELERYSKLLEEDSTEDQSLEVAKKYSELMNEIHEEKTGSSKGIAKNILIEDFDFDEGMLDRKIGTLSGGEKRKVELANFFSKYKDVDLFIMDEPTNHLDLEAKKYFEKYINDFNGSYFMVEHDRELLDNTVEKILELDDGEIEVYHGNYSDYEKKKKTRTVNKQMKLDRLEKKVKSEKEAIKNLELKASGGGDYIKKDRVRRLKGLKNKRDRLQNELRADEVDINLNLKKTPEEYTLLEVKKLTKSYDEFVFENITFDMKPGKKIALVGPNGSGKSTLLEIIFGNNSPDSGNVEVGKKTKIGYHAQEFTPASEDYVVLDDIWDKTYGEHRPITHTTHHLSKEKEEKLRNYLGGFGFTGDDVFKEVCELSGGEKTLLSVAEMMYGGCNLILLDEPTNNLDIEKRKKLEESIKDYEGGVLLASHDRRFIKNALDEAWSIKRSEIESYVLD
ncbi:MAG: ABC-F family ATP-binding cassette domain-containing protein [Candidatus Saliniplasma sp.]